MSGITSRDNPRLRRWRELVRDPAFRREEGAVMVEGPHLVSACLESGSPVRDLILSRSGAGRAELAALAQRSGRSPVVLSDALFRLLADTEAPAGIAAEIPLPRPGGGLGSAANCVFLDAIQDAGNVGTILRSAAAFGIHDAVLGRGCADAWSPKVLRAGMGAHFSMRLREQADLEAAIAEFGGRIACTAPRGGTALSAADLSGRVGWLLGGEGQGVSEPLARRATLTVTIPMGGTAESLNVAAAAAICFYAFSTRAARS